MSKLFFYYGIMGSSKSANALMTRFNYLEKGRKVWLIKPEIDTRDDTDGKAFIRSRIGIEAKADVIKLDDSILKRMPESIDVIICDEAQFLKEEQVDELRYIVSFKNIPVFCYGLRTDFKTKLFPGSKRLFELADRLVELESICECGEHAIVNARINNEGEVVSNGAQILLGKEDRYKPMCYKCFKEKTKKNIV